MVSILEAPHNAQAQRHLTSLRLRLSSKAAHAGGVVHLRAWDLIKMDRISDREPSRVIVLMACLWFPISLALINGHWLLSVFFLVGIWFFPVYFWKVKEVYFSEQAIKVKRGKGFVEIPLSKIQSVKHNPQFFRGCYKVVFKDRSPLGRYILFQAGLYVD